MRPLHRRWVLLALQLTGLWVTVFGVRRNSISECQDFLAELTCGAGEIIAISSVEYGYRKTYTRPCHFDDGDCRDPVESDISSLNTHCSGHRDCKIKTMLNPHRPTMCGRNVSKPVYRTIHYECIAENKRVRMCSDDVREGAEVFVTNQEYPSPIKGANSDCLCTVTSTSSTGITVTALDVTLGEISGHNTCPQEIQISNSTYSKTVNCLNHKALYGFREIHKWTGTDKRLQVKFQSTTVNTTGRYFLRIADTGDHSLKITCTSPGGTPKSVESSSVSSGSTDSTGNNDQPDGVLIGGIVAAVLFVAFIVTLLIMVIRHRKKRLERKSSQRSMDIKHGVIDPFLFSSESGNEQPPQNANAPAHPELVYATPGFTQPHEGRGISVQPHGHDHLCTHYTYITPDIIDTTAHQQGRNKKPPIPVPRIPTVPPVGEDRNGNMPYLVRNQPDVTERRISQKYDTNGGDELSQNGNDVIFVNNSLYESSEPYVVDQLS